MQLHLYASLLLFFFNVCQEFGGALGESKVVTSRGMRKATDVSDK